MADFKLKRKAIQDLNDIYEYTEINWSETQADKYYFSIKKACQQIADRPYSGKSYDHIKNRIYGKSHQKHIIFYEVLSNDLVEIIRILHAQMDLKNHLTK